MSGLFNRHASPRQFVATWLLLGVTSGILYRGTWTGDSALTRVGFGAMVVGSGVLLAVLFLTPTRFLPRMWQEEDPTFLQRTPSIVALLGGLGLSAACLWLSPWDAMATAAGLLAALAVAEAALLIVSSRSESA